MDFDDETNKSINIKNLVKYKFILKDKRWTWKYDRFYYEWFK